MKSWFQTKFLNNWQRKLISLILAIIIWILVNNSLVTERTYLNVPIKVKNIPDGMIIPNLRKNGYLDETTTITLEGYKKLLDELKSDDFYILVDAKNHDRDWIERFKKSQLVFFNRCNNSSGIRSLHHDPFMIPISKVNRDTND